LSVRTDGKVKVCCDNNESALDASGQIQSFRNSKLSANEIINSNMRKKLRLALASGIEDPGCSKCWELEEKGGESLRIGWQDRFNSRDNSEAMAMQPDGTIEKPNIELLELSLGNLCNFKCRMCSAQSSTTWIREAEHHGWENPAILQSLKEKSWVEGENFQEFISSALGTAKHLNFYGGEPLLIKKHYEYLKICIDKGQAANMTVAYATNLSHIPDDILEYWRHFKKVYLTVSCDGIGSHYEYIRYPGRWDVFSRNLDKLLKLQQEVPFEFSLGGTIQVLTVTRLLDMLKWYYAKMTGTGLSRIPFYGYVHTPNWLDPRILPQQLKDEAEQKVLQYLDTLLDLSETEQVMAGLLKGQLALMQEPLPLRRGQVLWSMFASRNEKMDRYRSQKLADHVPEIVPYLPKLSSYLGTGVRPETNKQALGIGVKG